MVASLPINCKHALEFTGLLLNINKNSLTIVTQCAIQYVAVWEIGKDTSCTKKLQKIDCTLNAASKANCYVL